jgi:hypothetical protein
MSKRRQRRQTPTEAELVRAVKAAMKTGVAKVCLVPRAEHTEIALHLKAREEKAMTFEQEDLGTMEELE